LKGASFMAVKAESLGGYLAAAGELQKNGIDKTDFRQLLFTGMPHQKVAENVLAGKVDAGTVRTGVLESLIASGTIKATDFKILNAKSTSIFPLMHSTELYPEWPFSVMPHIDNNIANAVALALISMSSKQHTKYLWKVSKNYRPVHQLMMNLKVPPYDKKESIWKKMIEYKTSLLSLLTALLLLLFFSVSLYRTNKRLVINQNRSKNMAETLEYIASSENLEKTLTKITTSIEHNFPFIRASILLLQRGRLYKGAAPSLPDDYNNALEGLEIGPNVGSCGTAAYYAKQVIVEDVSSSPLWAPYKNLALKHNLQSCWSEPIFDSQGQVLGTFAMYSDKPRSPTTLQLKDISSAAYLAGIAIERNLNENKIKKLALAIEQTAEAIIITNEKGEIEFINQSFTKITGYSLDEVLGKNPSILSSGRQDKEFYHNMWRSILEKGSWVGRIWNKRKSGDEFPERLHISTVKNDNGKIHYIGLFSDITEQVATEEQLIYAQKMEAIGTLVGGIAHDFNNILAGMLGNTYLIKKKLQDQPALSNKVKNIEDLGFRAKDLISQMLAFAHQGIVKKSNIDIADCLKKATHLAKAALPKEILFNENLGSEELTIFADGALLQQVIINIINNARDAVEGITEAKIKISLQRQRADSKFRKKYKQANTGDYAHLSISDNGSGMNKDIIQHIFDPFFTTKAINKGTGLGLSMALGTIQSHLGFIDVSSEPEQGSSFHIYLPLLQSSHKKDNKKKNTSAAFVKKHTHILIADDEPHILEILTEVLQEEGYIIHSAIDGKDALSVFQKNKELIQLAILDISMPGMAGTQVAKEIRESNPQFPIIFNSGYDKSNMPTDLISDKHCLKLQKPVEIHTLKQAVSNLLNTQTHD